MYIYIYIYIERERGRERKREREREISLSIYIYVYIHVIYRLCIYIYIYICVEAPAPCEQGEGLCYRDETGVCKINARSKNTRYDSQTPWGRGGEDNLMMLFSRTGAYVANTRIIKHTGTAPRKSLAVRLFSFLEFQKCQSRVFSSWLVVPRGLRQEFESYYFSEIETLESEVRKNGRSARQLAEPKTACGAR